MSTKSRFAILVCAALSLGASAPAYALAGKAAAGAKTEAAEGRQAKKVTSSEDYLPFETLSSPIAANYGFQGILVVEAGLDIPDAKLRARAALMGPKLRDAVRTALADYAYRHYRVKSSPDADKLAMLLQAAADRALGQPGAKLLLSSVMIQPGS